MSRHPQLSKKLSLLYSLRLNPTITSHTELAATLGIVRQSISKWAIGTETRKGNSIPNSQLDKVAAIFGIEAHWFTQTLEEFERNLRDKIKRDFTGIRNKPEKISVSLLPITNVRLFGRDKEFDELDGAWQDDRVNVLQILAFGGVGKSALVNSWLSRLNQENYRGATRVYAWSFYWQGSSQDIKSSGDYFIEHALDWFGDADSAAGTPWAKATRLANLIRSSRSLLILDGLEPMQHPPGPQKGEVENPAVALLIRELASAINGLCIITSRLSISDLSSYRDERIKTLELGRLSTQAGTLMLQSMGISGNQSDYEDAVKEYAGHPLSLSLLGGYLSVVYQAKIERFREIRSLLDEQSLGAHAKNLMRNYLDWFKDAPEYSLLLIVGLIDRAVSIEDVKLLVSRKTIKGLTRELESLTAAQWGYAVDKLHDAKLISADSRDGKILLDCHPLVRDFLSDFLTSEQSIIWRSGHELIFDYLQEIAVDNPSSMTELEPLFRAVIHGTQAGLYEEAFNLYFKRIKKGQFSMFTDGSHHADQACIRSFFKNIWTEPVSELEEEAQFYLLSCASANLIYLGNIQDAVEPSVLSINWFIENKRWVDALNIAAPIASMLMISGKLNEALELIENMQECVSNTQNDVIKAMSCSFHAFALHLNGQDQKAKCLFEQAEAILIKSAPDSTVTFPTVSSYYCKFLLDSGESRQALKRSLKTFTWRKQQSWQVAIDTTSLLASDIQVLGLAFLELGDFVNAKVHLDKQVGLLRAADEWLYLPTGLNARARYAIATGDYQSAIDDLDESRKISQRTGARFGEWEACIDTAQLFYKKSDFAQSKAYLQKARELPGMSVYQFRNTEIMELEAGLAVGIDLKEMRQSDRQTV